MTELIIGPKGAPVSNADPFSLEHLIEPHTLHEQLRATGPVVYFDRYDIWGMARYEQVNAALKDWKNFSSAAGVGLSDSRTEEPWRQPSLLLESDPPIHTGAREVFGPILSPRRLQAAREHFEREASALVDRIVAHGEFDVTSQFAEMYSLNVFADVVGLPKEGREHLLTYGYLVFNSFGPRNHNQLLEDSMTSAKPVTQWILDSCTREALSPGGIGEQVWMLVDAGKITAEWAALLVRSLLTAGILTTSNAIAAALYGLASQPDQWNMLRQDPSLAAQAYEEAVRWETPIQTFFRTTTREVEIAGVRIPADKKVILFLGSANRDPRQWTNPDHFDIRRNAAGHVGFGMGIHRCVGQTLTRMEGEILLTALARRVEQITITGQPQRRPNNSLYAWKSLPVTVYPSSA
jgi:4-methoxybenzoate monooxygenase (O-demethylating)